MSNPKDEFVKFLRQGYEKKHGHEPTGKDARKIEQTAANTAAEVASRQHVHPQKYHGG